MNICISASMCVCLNAGFVLLFGMPACGFCSFTIFIRICLLLERRKNLTENIQNNIEQEHVSYIGNTTIRTDSGC